MKVIAASAAIMAAAAVLMTQNAGAQDGGPPPSAGTLLASGLAGTQGAAVGPDGALYVTEGGSGGDIETTPPDDFPPDEPVPTFGLTGRVSRIDPATGARTTAGEGLPSLGGPEGGFGAVDVAFIGDDMYVLTTGDADAFGQEDWPNGIYSVDGSNVDLVADISDFNRENPVEFPDASPGGNPFALDVRGNEFFVTDGNYNRVLRVTSGGAISLFAEFTNVVPTGLETETDSESILVTQFGAFPHTAENSALVGVGPDTEVRIAGGFAQLIDVENTAEGDTFVLQFGTTDVDPEGDPFSGKILTLAGGTLSPLVTGFMLPTSLDFSGDTAYVTTLLGEVWQIENFSTVAPPAIEPTRTVEGLPVITVTPTPATGVTAPDTGTGPTDGHRDAMLLIALAFGALGLATGGAALVTKRS